MDLKIDIKPEHINKMVAEAVLNSAIGEQVEAVVKKNVKELGRGYDNPIDAVVKKHISDLIVSILATEHGEELKKQVKEAVSEKITSEFVSKIVDAAWSKM